jgi:dihydroxyacetone kinase-like protein
MGQAIDLAQFRQWMLAYADLIQQQEAYLTELDAAIGDADHGANMRRGLDKVRDRLSDPNLTVEDVGALLRMVAMTLISTVGGAAGPLYGAFFLRAAQAVDNSRPIDVSQLAAMFRSGLAGVQQRGKAQLNDKTMIDAMQPAVEALEAAAEAGATVEAALDAAHAAAEKGMHHTIGLQANRGRASYLGPRSIGHQDPGATSVYLLFQAAAAPLGDRAGKAGADVDERPARDDAVIAHGSNRRGHSGS